MAKKKPSFEEETEVVNKTLDEMTDSEFLAGVERFGAPLYFDYLCAPRTKDMSVNGYLSETQIGILARNAKMPVKETKAQEKEPQTQVKTSKNYVRKHILPIAVILLVSIAMLVIVGMGVIENGDIGKSIALYESEDGDVGIIDTVVSMFEYLLDKDGEGNYIAYYADAGSEYALIPVYAVSCAVILFTVCFVIMLIKSACALFEKRTVCGYYKKRKFGFLSIVALLCGAICLIGGIYITGGDITAIGDFFLRGERAAVAGYGLYVMFGAAAVTFIMSCIAYGKKRK